MCCIGTNGESLRDKNKLAYSGHQALPMELLSDPIENHNDVEPFESAFICVHDPSAHSASSAVNACFYP